jgi:autotransporter-associated beta strand protein
MPPKADPYATPAQRRIDVILVLICILAAVFLFLSSSHGRVDNNSETLGDNPELMRCLSKHTSDSSPPGAHGWVCRGAFLALTSARAAPLYWDTSTSAGLQAGNGNWSLSGGGANLRWSTAITGSPTLANWTNGSDAFFETSGTSLVSVNGAITVNSMIFDGTGYTIGFTSGSLSLVGSNITTNADATISTVLSGSVGLTKLGASILTLSGANIYTGGTTLSAGTLKLSGTGTLGSTSGSLTVNAGTLDLNGTTQTVGNFTGSGGTVLNNNTGTNITFTIGNGNGTGGNYQGVIADHSSGTGTVALTKTGTGTITLSGANTYSGGTTVGAGTLFVNNTSGSGTGTGTVTVNGTGTLGGNGTISGAVNVSASGATINPGATAGAIGTLNTGALTLSNSSKFSVDMLSGSGNADQINVTGAVNITLATLQLNIPNGTVFAAGDQYVLINNDLADAISGTFANAPAGTDTIDGYSWIVSYTSANGLGNDFVLTAVPEPSTWLAAALALGAIGFSQRKRLRVWASSAVERHS